MPLGFLTIIADCGPDVGLGHVMRSLAIAEAAAEAGISVTFESPALPENVLARLATSDITHRQPGGASDRADAILLDGYRFTRGDVEAYRDATPLLAAIDDNGEKTGLPLDLVINPNPHADAALYGDWSGPRFLLGPDYVPLRREFLAYQPESSQTERPRILVTLGGADPKGATLPVLEALEAVEQPLDIRVVMGGLATDIAPQSERHHLDILRNVANMAPVMAWADVAISAAGSSLWELAHLGVPTLAIIVADNQIKAAKAAERLGMIRLTTAETVAPDLAALLTDGESRQTLAEAGRAKVDGQGAQRILAALLPNVSEASVF